MQNIMEMHSDGLNKEEKKVAQKILFWDKK